MNNVLARHYGALKKKLRQDSIGTQAAALAFFTAFSVAPLLFLILFILSSLRLDMQAHLIAQIQSLVGTDAADVIETVIYNLNAYPTSNIWGALTLGVSASVIFVQLQNSLNVIFQVKHDKREGFVQHVRHFFFRRLLCFAMVFIFLVFSIGSLLASGYANFTYDGNLQVLFRALHSLISLSVYSIMFASLFKWVPDRNVSWKTSLQGGLFTALLFVLGKLIFGSFLGLLVFGSPYGTAGSLLVLLMWVYLSSMIFLFGAEVCAVLNLQPRKKSVVRGLQGVFQ